MPAAAVLERCSGVGTAGWLGGRCIVTHVCRLPTLAGSNYHAPAHSPSPCTTPDATILLCTLYASSHRSTLTKLCHFYGLMQSSAEEAYLCISAFTHCLPVCHFTFHITCSLAPPQPTTLTTAIHAQRSSFISEVLLSWCVCVYECV